MTNLEKLQAAQALRVKESSWIPRTVGWLGAKGWGAAKYLAPKALKGPKISQGPRRALGWLGQSYGGAASGVGNFGLRNSKHGGKFFKALRDLGYQGQNFGTLQRDIIGNQAWSKAFAGGNYNPANWGRHALRNWSGFALGSGMIPHTAIPYFGLSPMNLVLGAQDVASRAKAQPRIPRAPRPPVPSHNNYTYATNYPRR